MDCSRCGARTTADARFCGHCGVRFDSRDVWNLDDVVAQIKALTTIDELIPYDSVNHLASALGGRRPTVAQLSPLSDLADDQSCRWTVKYLFSRASAPDLEAKEESELWTQLYGDCVASLVKTIPELEDVQRESHEPEGHGIRVTSPVGTRWKRFRERVRSRCDWLDGSWT